MNRSDGFSLTELLTVIAIITVLASLVFPALSTAKSYSKSVSCRNHLHQMGVALKMYTDDHQSVFPYYLGPAGPSYGDEKTDGMVYWSSKLFPYYPLNWTNSLFHCPGYTGTNTGPYFKPSIDRLGSYAYNIWGSAVGGMKFKDQDFGIGPVVSWGAAPVSENQVRQPSDMLTVGESRFLTADKVTVGPQTFGPNPGGDDTLYCGSRLSDPPFDPARHGKNYNYLLCDGHVSSMKPAVLFNPTNTASMWNYDYSPHTELW